MALLTSACGVQSEVSPKAIWGDVGTKFPHPRDGCDVSLSGYTFLCTGFLALYSTLQYLRERVQLAFA